MAGADHPFRSGASSGRRLSRRQFAGSLLPARAATSLAAASVLGRAAQDPGMPMPTGKIRVLLDTDAGNAIDDQFALAYAFLSTEKIALEAVYAAPFANGPKQTPEEGMETTYAEIGRVLNALRAPERVPRYKGSRAWLPGSGRPAWNPAAEDLAERVLADGPDDLFVVALGAATNVATALLLEPRLVQRANIVWLGGSPHHFPSAEEYNLKQDPRAARVLFDSGARLMHTPAPGVAEYLLTHPAELARRLEGQSGIGDYLFGLFREYSAQRHVREGFPYSKPIWDLAPVAWLVNPAWVPSMLAPSPALTDGLKWSAVPGRHRIRVALRVSRDEIFADFFRKIGAAPA